MAKVSQNQRRDIEAALSSQGMDARQISSFMNDQKLVILARDQLAAAGLLSSEFVKNSIGQTASESVSAARRTRGPGKSPGLMHLSVMVNGDVLEGLRGLADREGLLLSNLVRRVLSDYWNSHKVRS